MSGTSGSFTFLNNKMVRDRTDFINDVFWGITFVFCQSLDIIFTIMGHNYGEISATV